MTVQGVNLALFQVVNSHVRLVSIALRLMVLDKPVIKLKICKCIGNGA